MVGLFPRLRLKISTGSVVAGSAASAEDLKLVAERIRAVRVSCEHYVMSLDIVTAAEACSRVLEARVRVFQKQLSTCQD